MQQVACRFTKCSSGAPPERAKLASIAWHALSTSICSSHSQQILASLHELPQRLDQYCLNPLFGKQGDSATDLDYYDESSLVLHGNTTITGENGVPASLDLPLMGYAAVYRSGTGASLGSNKDLVIDTSPPFVVQVTGKRSSRNMMNLPPHIWCTAEVIRTRLRKVIRRKTGFRRLHFELCLGVILGEHDFTRATDDLSLFLRLNSSPQLAKGEEETRQGVCSLYGNEI